MGGFLKDDIFGLFWNLRLLRELWCLEGFWFLLEGFFWRFLYFCMVKCSNFPWFFVCLKILFNVNSKTTMWHTPCCNKMFLVLTEWVEKVLLWPIAWFFMSLGKYCRTLGHSFVTNCIIIRNAKIFRIFFSQRKIFLWRKMKTILKYLRKIIFYFRNKIFKNKLIIRQSCADATSRLRYIVFHVW
jgi:hypothetical protein